MKEGNIYIFLKCVFIFSNSYLTPSLNQHKIEKKIVYPLKATTSPQVNTINSPENHASVSPYPQILPLKAPRVHIHTHLRIYGCRVNGQANSLSSNDSSSPRDERPRRKIRRIVSHYANRANYSAGRTIGSPRQLFCLSFCTESNMC